LNKMRLKKNLRAITLLELLLSIIILSVITTPLFVLFNQAYTNNINARVMSTMAYVGQYAMETMISADFYSLVARDGQAYAANLNPYFPSSDSYLNHFRCNARVDTINRNYAGNLADAAATVTRPSPYTIDQVSSNYIRIYVLVTNDIVPEKTFELWTIITPAGRGY